MAAGVQHFTWDLQYAPVTPFPGMVLWGATTNGPLALPGTYQARLTVDGQVLTQPITVKKHPLYTISDADMKAQFDLASRIRDKVNEANEARSSRSGASRRSSRIAPTRTTARTRRRSPSSSRRS